MSDGRYDFVSKCGRYMFFVFVIWSILYVLDRWVAKTHYLINCCSLFIALIGCFLFEAFVGWVLEID